MPASVAEEIDRSGINPALLGSPQPELEMAHLFVVRKDELLKTLALVRDLLAPAGIVWVSWPKKAARVPTDLSGDAVRAAALPLGLVDIKVCAVDETWSGLKLMIRRSERLKTSSGAP
jgi:hypothetical protein